MPATEEPQALRGWQVLPGPSAARTVKGIRAVLRSALSQVVVEELVVEELVVKNVAALVKRPPIRNRKGKSWSSEVISARVGRR
ncbi:hypothetical protein [Micromonospora sp. NPDC005206]|uniref:hypothetical protein n=1 Tax=Micromonospora sp. NPDC005206 TaxID=3157022 RepID=UPI0033B57E81